MLFGCCKGMRTPFDISPASEIFHVVIAYIFKVQCIEAMVIAILNWAMVLKKQSRRGRQEPQRAETLQNEL